MRGIYDVAGLRGDADFMIWWHAETIEQLQSAYHRLLRTELGQHLEPVWSSAALHRPAEFNKSHIPAFMADEVARKYVCVYPFVRSYEWYLLEDGERRDLLREHGQMARDFPDVRANTIASFALGDYEWLLAFEADELHRIVDLMRELRASRARHARARGDPLLHRAPGRAGRARRQPALTAAARRAPSVVDGPGEDRDDRDEQEHQPRVGAEERDERDERREAHEEFAPPCSWRLDRPERGAGDGLAAPRRSPRASAGARAGR